MRESGATQSARLQSRALRANSAHIECFPCTSYFSYRYIVMLMYAKLFEHKEHPCCSLSILNSQYLQKLIVYHNNTNLPIYMLPGFQFAPIYGVGFSKNAQHRARPRQKSRLRVDPRKRTIYSKCRACATL